MPYARNAHTHSQAQVGQIAASIKELGFSNTILAGADGVIVAGHRRLAAAQQLGVCCVCMSSSELHTLQKAWLDAGGKWSTFLIWAKNTFTLCRADHHRQYEPILYA